MNFNTIILSLAFISCMNVTFATVDSDKENQVISSVKKCECGPTEHCFFKACVKRYNKQFAGAGLLENNDTEGLSENILKAIELFAQDLLFVDGNGIRITPEFNAKGNLFLPMIKNPDFILCKQILRNVDVSTTLTAQELYQQWSEQLKLMKSTK